MFGYLTVDSKSLSSQDKKRYQAFYCGLCRQLGLQFGYAGQMSLANDLVFLSILLSSLYEQPLYGQEEESGTMRCVLYPVRHSYVITPAAAYAADLNVVLAYYKCLDDIKDNRSAAAKKNAALLEKFLPQIKSRRPRQAEVIEKSLEQLNFMEKENVLNPDIPANCFGCLMAEIFVMDKEDSFSPALRRMGAALGRFIYLMDACNDLHSDLKKGRYNPLAARMDTDFKPVLMMMIGECTNEFEKLPLKRDAGILRNILYSGVWMKYKRGKKDSYKGDNKA
ncbi:MAG: DUF5685 family protein [Treponema sp.]|nr:DUF5685 family protein [Treponema sp.]